MSTSWDLLQDTMEETMEEVNNVLGDFLIHQIEHDKSSLADLYPSETHYRPPLCQEFEAVKEDMEPQPRARSNTWPKRQFGLKTGESIGLPQVNEETSSELGVGQSSSASGRYLVNNSSGEVPASPLHRKNSRRNPWGNCSYSDLIEQVQHNSTCHNSNSLSCQAILSSPDKRLTLNQVYDWLISNVSYFSDRQDSLASGGWKVTSELHN